MPGNRRRGKGSTKNVESVISRRLRAARLTAPPAWYASPGRYKDPPELPNTPPYFIKLRLFGTTVPLTTVSLTAVGLSTTLNQNFGIVVVSRIDVWGTASDNTVCLQVNLPTPTGTVANNSTFFGTGVLGARRPYVSVMISPKDAEEYATGNASAIAVATAYDTKGNRTTLDLMFDVHCTFFASSLTLDKRAGRLDEIKE